MVLDEKNSADKSISTTPDTTNQPPSTPISTAPILRMKQGNVISISQIQFTPAMFNMIEEMELAEVKKVYAYDNEKKKPILDRVEAVTYTCVDGKSWYIFKVPNQNTPLISQEEIDSRNMARNPVFVKVPLDKIVFKPYQTDHDHGTLHLSLQIPYIELL